MCEITIKQDKNRIIIDEIFRIVPVIFNMYITHNILHLVNYNLFLIYEFATNRNLVNLRRTYAQGLPARASLKWLILRIQSFITCQPAQTDLPRHSVKI